MRIRLELSYIGTAYHGWQVQATTDATIQGVLEKALSVLCRAPIRCTGAGRTDAGVHALGQVAHADIPALLQRDLRIALNALLPKDIAVLDVRPVADTFHARFDAHQKTYVYHFWTERAFLLPTKVPFVWSCGPLDVDLMNAALAPLLGTHDFTSFQNAGADTTSAVRTISSANIAPLPQHPFLPHHNPEYVLTITADGFLKQMVRNIAGLLVAAGQKKIGPAVASAILDARDRKANPCRTAPAAGLTLQHIEYLGYPRTSTVQRTDLDPEKS